MTGQFEQLTINNELTADEAKAIDALDPATDVLKISSLKTALASEVIKGTNENFLAMADEFVKYVSYTKETNNGIEVIPAGLTCDEKAPNRLKILIKKPEENDFAYFLYKVSIFLSVPVANLEAKKIGEKTRTQLEALKKVIPPPDKTANAPTVTTTANAPTATTTVNAPTATTTVNVVPTAIETLKSEEIKITLYKVTPDQVVKAIDTLKKSNPTLANTIIPLLRSGDTKGVQKALNMQEGAALPLYKQADGIFGKMSLKNLEAGTVVKYTGTGV